MSLGATALDYAAVLADLGVSLTYQAVTNTSDPIYGAPTAAPSYSSSTKTWIFFKRSSTLELTKWGIVDTGDAYVVIPATDTINFGDRVSYNSETFEYTPDCKSAEPRFANGVQLYKYYALKKVA